MNDKEYQIEKKRIQTLIKKWVKPIGLGWWNIRFEYERADKNSGDTTYAPMDIGGYYETVMETRCDPYYLNAAITVYCRVTKEMSDEDLELAFVHELMHVFLSPMHTKQTRKEEELVATKLAQGFIWSRGGGGDR